MSFAYWRKCDFQVHTPRDPNWVGARPVGQGEVIEQTREAATPEDVATQRAEWAGEFVNQCVAKGLEAIALTDHHEMVMVPYVQKAIAERKKADESFDFWLFPGMELTASGGKQCLIIFDANLSEDWRKQAQGKLGIVYADLDENSAKALGVTQLTCNYADIGSLLDELAGLRGKYIVLPNVSQGNQHTVLINGAHADFRRMPYVGAYLDQNQTLITLGSKNRKRLSGKDKVWSAREIYPIPTSDSRSSDYATLGENNTWIKLAEPTAEAIRQAFLGHQSRIRIETPKIPSLVVGMVEVRGSAILQESNFLLSPELNSVIGGRGTGKSCFLEYVAFGLGRSCYDVPRDHYSGTERMHDLIKDTLVSKDGSVTLTVIQDNAEFKIVRGPATAHQPQVFYPNGSNQTATVKELRALFPAVVYSQGELSEIGKQAGKRAQLTDLLQFVNPEYKREDDQLGLDVESAKNAVKSAIQALTEHWELQSQLRKLLTARDSLRQRAEALEKTLPTLSGDDQAVVDHFDNANEFESKRIQASDHADQILEELKASATELLNERDIKTDLTGHAATIRQRYRDLYQGLESGLNKLQTELKGKRDELSAVETQWGVKFKEARSARDKVLEKFSAHKTVTSQIKKLRDEITDITNQIGSLEAKLKVAADPTSILTQTLKGLRKTVDQRATRTQEWAQEIEKLSSGTIKAVVDIAGDTSQVKDAVDLVASKTGSQEATRLKALEAALASAPVWDVLDRLRSECLAVLYWRQLGAASGEKQPDIAELTKIVGDTERILGTLIERMDAFRVEAIATAVPTPEIILSYCDDSREISFEKASEGQRAAALLFMLLEQPGGPLIIDQPEGDLDNRIIADLTEKLHDAKRNRQLIFASHNANIVVNGSSELVGHLDVKESGERHFDCSGAIDEPSVCEIITSTMEGGEKAFKDRQDKYGF